MTVLLVASLALTGALVPSRAMACGGFFCGGVRVDQSGEYIMFSLEPDGVTAYVQIQYQGKANDFAWVVPVMSVPKKIGVGVQQVFTTLMNATVPQFRINWQFPDGGQCFARVAPGGTGPQAAGNGASDKGVQVLAAGEVGPYNYVVVQATEADKLKKWLDDNGFVQPDSAV